MINPYLLIGKMLDHVCKIFELISNDFVCLISIEHDFVFVNPLILHSYQKLVNGFYEVTVHWIENNHEFFDLCWFRSKKPHQAQSILFGRRCKSGHVEASLERWKLHPHLLLHLDIERLEILPQTTMFFVFWKSTMGYEEVFKIKELVEGGEWGYLEHCT